MSDGTSGGDDRIVRETGIDARIAQVVLPVLRGGGFRLVRARLFNQNGLTLQVMAERPDGTMDVEGCEAVSRALSPALDVEGPVDQAYHLEVSSPGIDRPLVRRSDFQNWLGHLVKVETSILVGDRKRFKGRIAAADESSVTIDRDAPGYGDEPSARIPFEAISEARLVLTDDLIREALSKDNRARKEARKRRGEPEDDPEDTQNENATED